MARMREAHPERTAMPAPPPDEISLRELYLVLRRRAPWIVTAAAVVAVVVGLALALRAPIFVAEATTVVARAPIEVDLGTGLRFRPEVNVTFDIYQTLAFSRGVLEELALARDVPVADLRRALTLERVTGAAQVGAFLAVAHQVADRDPQRAARIASLWAEMTIQRARDLLLENLDAVEVITGVGLEGARAALREAETAYQDYLATAEVEALGSRFLALDAAANAEVDGLRAAELALVRRRSELDALLAARAGSGVGTLQVVLTDAPEVAVTLDGAIASLTARIAGDVARLDAGRAAIDRLTIERSAVARELADVTVQVGVLQRGVDDKARAVAALATLEPGVAYVAQVAPSGARVLSAALVPTEHEPRRVALIALLAGIVVGFGGAVLALLAEAVRDPRTNGA